MEKRPKGTTYSQGFSLRKLLSEFSQREQTIASFNAFARRRGTYPLPITYLASGPQSEFEEKRVIFSGFHYRKCDFWLSGAH